MIKMILKVEEVYNFSVFLFIYLNLFRFYLIFTTHNEWPYSRAVEKTWLELLYKCNKVIKKEEEITWRDIYLALGKIDKEKYRFLYKYTKLHNKIKTRK